MRRAPTLAELIELAGAASLDPQLIREATDELVELELLVLDLERQRDRRKAHTADLARRVGESDDRLRRNGTGRRVALLAEQFGVSKPSVYRLLRNYRVTRYD
jgi:DNA-binding IclR family transcriptional regulator